MIILDYYFATVRGERFFDFEVGERRPLSHYTYQGFVFVRDLEDAFFQLQDNPCKRSLSVGDVLRQDDRWFVTQAVGFAELKLKNGAFELITA